MKEKTISSPKIVICVRVSKMEKMHLEELASIAGLTRSEYLRRRFFGGRPIIAHTDLCTIRELRRLGGLLKHNFETLREANAPRGIFEKQEQLLQQLYVVADRIGK